MRKLLPALTVMITACCGSNAFALSTYVPIMQCTHLYNNSSITVAVSQYEGPTTLGANTPNFDVEIYNSILVPGQQPQIQLEARFQGVGLAPAAQGVYGAPETFEAQGLTLAIVSTTKVTPNPSGYAAQLNAVVNNHPISIEVYCVPAQSPTGASPPAPAPAPSS